MHQNQCTGFRILLIRFVFTRVYENRKKGANDYCERSKGGRVMRNFFTRLRVCEDEILYSDFSEYEKSFSQKTRNTTARLVAYVENGLFTKSPSAKFIASNFRLSIQDLLKEWEKEFGVLKSSNTIRSQISQASMALYSIFGESFADDLMSDNSFHTSEILDAIELGSAKFTDLFQSDLCMRIQSAPARPYKVSELEKELRVLKTLHKVDMRKTLRGLDIDKLMFIRQVLDRNLIVDYQLNETKLEILKKLDALPTLPMKEMEVPHLDKWFTDIFDKVRDRTRTEVDSRNVNEIKKLVFYAFTEEGLKKTLSSYTKDEFVTALKELGEGI